MGTRARPRCRTGDLRRGDLYWADVEGGRRPVLLLARERAYEQLTAVIAAPITTTLRDIPSHVRLGVENGLAHESAANCDALTLVRVAELLEPIGRLDATQAEALDEALRYALGLADESGYTATRTTALTRLTRHPDDPDPSAP
jgi:mRNA interferase MazF